MRNIELGEQMLVSAVRYALGRQTYIVKQTVDEVLRVWDQLSPGVQAVISRDVRDADSWGVECDEEQWMRVLECGGVCRKYDLDRAEDWEFAYCYGGVVARYIPAAISVLCDGFPSRLQNKAEAVRRVRARVMELEGVKP